MDEMNQYNYQQTGDPVIEKSANTSKILGIVGIVAALCCTYAGLACGIIGLVKAMKILGMPDASEKALADAKVGKICGIVAIAIAGITIIANIAMMASGNNPIYNMIQQG